MMDDQYWVYIIIGLIYFLSKVLKKPQQTGEESPESNPPGRRRVSSHQTSTESPRQLTFEELLREITEGKKPPKPAPRPEPVSSYERDDREVDDEARSLEEIPDEEADARVFKAYEDAKRQVSERQSLEETLRLRDTDMKFGKFKAFEKEQGKNLPRSYINILRNPETLKQAVVLSEILKRKF